jgi:putative ABC transport system substrate-binding protein
MIKRRTFIAGLGSAATWPVMAWAQQSDRMRRIGILMAPESEPVAQVRLSALVQALREFGWTEGQNLRIELRGTRTGDIDRIRAAAAELVASNPHLVCATATPIVQELQRQTRTIPILFLNIGDPVDTNIVGSLARPGGNATGFSNWEPAMGGKRLALLKEVAPGVNRVLVMVNSGSDSNQHELRATEAPTSSFGVYCARRVCSPPVHSALIPNSFIIGHHLSASAFTSAASASGVCRSRGKIFIPRFAEPRARRRSGWNRRQ